MSGDVIKELLSDLAVFVAVVNILTMGSFDVSTYYMAIAIWIRQ